MQDPMNPTQDPAKESNTEESAVGYGKPPKATQFQKGRSGNVKGRPKGQRNIQTILRDLADEPIEIKVGGKTKRTTKLDAMLIRTMHQALEGDPRAQTKILSLLKQHDIHVEDDSAPRAGVLMVERPIITDEEWKARWGPDSLNTIAKVDRYEKQMIKTCEYLRETIRKTNARCDELAIQYAGYPGLPKKVED